MEEAQSLPPLHRYFSTPEQKQEASGRHGQIKRGRKSGFRGEDGALGDRGGWCLHTAPLASHDMSRNLLYSSFLSSIILSFFNLVYEAEMLIRTRRRDHSSSRLIKTAAGSWCRSGIFAVNTHSAESSADAAAAAAVAMQQQAGNGRQQLLVAAAVTGGKRCPAR